MTVSGTQRTLKPTASDAGTMQAARARETILGRAYEVSPDQFEVLCKLVLSRTLETSVLSVTPASQDGGIDVEGRLDYDWFAADYGVQVKRFAADNRVSSDRIHRLAGALSANGYDVGTFITTSSFTGPAVDVAEQLPIKLVSGETLAETMLRTEVGVTRRDGEYELADSFWTDLERTEERIPAGDVPLASNFTRIRAVLEAMRRTEGTKAAIQSWVAVEYDLNLEDRHVYINANSATVLGLARKEPATDDRDVQRWGVTKLGAEYLASPPRSQAAEDTLATAIRSVGLVERLLEEMEAAGSLTISEIDAVIDAETTGLSESSVSRRSSSVRTWLSKLPEVRVERESSGKVYHHDPSPTTQSGLGPFDDG